jgi:dTDP-4-dehydrorhamnose reductase
MKIHDKNIFKSIDINIIGTANIVKICSKLKIKLIFISTSYVYPGTKNNYKENSAINPINNYGLSKMGGEASVRMYKNSLTVRASMTENPFVHKYAFDNFITNFIYHENFVKILMHLLDLKGIINVGGKSRSVYDFAISKKLKVKKKSAKKVFGFDSKINLGMNLDKLNKILKSKKYNL